MANERAQIEEVFGLTGGELEDKPIRFAAWNPKAVILDSHGRARVGAWKPWRRPYWYQGAPDYARELERAHREVITIVSDETFGEMPCKIVIKGQIWRKVATYRSSGEVPCNNTWDPQDGECPICEGTHAGSEYIYIGEGWAEIVYAAR